MNPSQAPWPLNKLKEAQLNRESLAKRASKGDDPETTSLEEPSIYSQKSKPGFTQDSEPLEIVSDTQESTDIASNDSEIIDTNTESEDLDAGFEPRHSFDIQDPNTEAIPKLEDISEDTESSNTTKLFLVVGGIVAIIFAGFLAYENPITLKDVKRNSSNMQNSKDHVTTNTFEHKGSNIINDPAEKRLPGNFNAEEAGTTSLNYQIDSLTGDISTTASSIDTPSTQIIPSDDSKKNIADTDLSGNTNQTSQLLNTQVESAGESQLEVNSETISLVTQSDHAVADIDSSEKIENLLRQAQSMFDKLQLTLPPGQNALANYQKVLEIDPGNISAIDGIEAIKLKLFELGKYAKVSNQWDKAEKRFQKLIELDPQSQFAELARTELMSMNQPAQ